MLARRLTAVFRFSFRSSAIFANRRSILVSLFATPVFEIFTSYFLGHILRSPNPTDIALRGLLLSVVLMTATFIVLTFAYDRETGVLAQIISYHPLDFQYIAGITLAAVIVSTISGLMNLICLAFVFQIQSEIINIIGIFPLALLCGTAFGILCATTAFIFQDPYAALNFLAPFLPLTIGVLVPLSEYPSTIERFLRFIPPASTLESIGLHISVFILSDYLISIALLFLSLLLIRRAAKNFRASNLLLQI